MGDGNWHSKNTGFYSNITPVGFFFFGFFFGFFFFFFGWLVSFIYLFIYLFLLGALWLFLNYA